MILFYDIISLLSLQYGYYFSMLSKREKGEEKVNEMNYENSYFGLTERVNGLAISVHIFNLYDL